MTKELLVYPPPPSISEMKEATMRQCSQHFSAYLYGPLNYDIGGGVTGYFAGDMAAYEQYVLMRYLAEAGNTPPVHVAIDKTFENFQMWYPSQEEYFIFYTFAATTRTTRLGTIHKYIHRVKSANTQEELGIILQEFEALVPK